jgi:hypothetical protein
MADRIVNTKSKIREITGVVLNTDDKIGASTLLAGVFIYL